MTVKQEYVYGTDAILTDGVMIYAKNGTKLTECMRVSPSYRNKGVFNELSSDMAAAIIMLLERGMSSQDLAVLLAKSEA